MTKIAIIIRTFNEAEFLQRSLSAIMQQSEQDFKIIMVDSGSTDDTVRIARSYENIKVIEIPRSGFSYGRALNIGINSVTDDATYVAMLSAHAIPCDKNWLSALIRPMEEDARVAGVYGKQIPFPEHMSNPIVRILADEAYKECYGDTKICTNKSYFFSNANAAIRMIHWTICPFDERLPYSEDWKWAKTMIENGSWLAYEPLARVYHSHPDTYKSFFKRKCKEEMANRLNHPLGTPILTKGHILVKLGMISYKYVKDIKGKKKLKGQHLDSYFVDIVKILAAYWGRINAQI